MKNMYRATRPAWASLERMETLLITTAGFLIFLFSAPGRLAYDAVYARLFGSLSYSEWVWNFIEFWAPILVCFGMIRFYQRFRVGSYPSFFIYCFHIPEDSNPGRRTRVVGYLHIKPDTEEGEMNATGVSITWDGTLVPNSAVRYQSSRVYGSKKGKEITCHIRYDITEADQYQRTYQRGVLEFQLVRQAAKGSIDQYAAYMRSTNADPDVGTAPIRCKGYAEKIEGKNLTSDEIQSVLEKKGDLLFLELNNLLSRWLDGVPSVWVNRTTLVDHAENFFGHRIPCPQSVLLSSKLATHIDAAMDKILIASGLSTQQIYSFKKTARVLARQDEEFPVQAFETDLRQAISDKKQDAALRREVEHQTKAIFEQIKSSLEGASVLEVRCGNPPMSDLLTSEFQEVRSIDVGNSVDLGSRTSFAHPKDGHLLPVERPFETVLLVDVLHRSQEPIRLLGAAWERAARRLIVVESVIGVHPERRHPGLASLEDDDQAAYLAFVDWFRNRILLDGIPGRHNFTTPDKWQSIFRENQIDTAGTKYLSFEVAIGDENRVSFVLEKPESALNRELNASGAAV